MASRIHERREAEHARIVAACRDRSRTFEQIAADRGVKLVPTCAIDGSVLWSHWRIHEPQRP